MFGRNGSYPDPVSDLDFLRERVPGYADYADEDHRHLVDPQMRSYLGEALSLARERLRPEGETAEQLDGLLLRCEFSDQRAIRATDHAKFGSALVDRIHALDRELVETADRIRDADAQALPALLDTAARVMDQRFGAIAEAPST